MKAMLWKELRENLRWAVLGCLVLTLAEFYVLSGLQRAFENSGDANITLSDATFLMVVLFGSVLVASGLGALQVLPELSRDRWAALLHRPVSRSVIFGGKVVAGLGLYAAAVLLPFLASTCYVAWPGKFAAPFVPGLMLPGLYAMAGGVAFYFGALLLCLHRGRWLGTRGILLVSVGALFLLQMNGQGLFLFFPLVSAAVLALAAWHAMLGEDAVERGRWLRRAAFVVVILLGAQATLMLVAAGLDLLPKPKNHFTYTRLEVTRDDQILRVRTGENGESEVVTDLAGNRITDERYVGNNSYQNFCEFWPLIYRNLRQRRSQAFEDNPLQGINHVREVRLGNQAKENWFLLVRRNYFVGYDDLSRRCVGICDREGFKDPGAVPVPFPAPLQTSFFSGGTKNLFWTDHQIYAINFFDREIQQPVVRIDRTIDTVMQLPVRSESEDFRYLVLALEDGLEVLDEHGGLVFTRPYLHDLQRWNSVEIATNQAVNRFYFLSQTANYRRLQTDGADTTYLDEVNLRGELVGGHGEVLEDTAVGDPRWLLTAQACLMPILPVLAQLVHSGLFSPSSEQSLSNDALSLGFAGWLGIILLNVALAAVALAWARRLGLKARGAWSWTAFVLVFGPAGLLTFRLAAGWPQRVRCPSCGHLRSLARETCAHCHQPWAAPQPSGTEILQLSAT